ncbi:MAG TPA: DUF885 domain-containing protein [Steroidobacteraceae bacterium]|nr:DUF885 domain-containing protein [Steroidobacteraceae bacterium]
MFIHRQIGPRGYVRAARFLATALVALAGCDSGGGAGERWTQYVDEFTESYFRAHPDFAVGSGRHEFDGQLPDTSAAGIAAEIERLRAERRKAVAYFESRLSAAERFQRDYIVAVIDRDLYWLDKARQPFWNPAFYVGVLDPNFYISREYAAPEVRIAAFTKYAGEVPRVLADARKNLVMPLSRTLLQYGIDSFGGFADYFEQDVPVAFAAVTDPKLKADFAANNAKAIAAYRDFTAYLKSQLPAAKPKFALGAELFAIMVRDTEGVNLPLEDLEAAGKADLERNLQALREACVDYLKGKSVEECVARASAKKPAGGTVAAATAQLPVLRSFIVEHDLVTIPGTEQAKVAEAPPYARSNFAFINIPGPYEKNLPSIYNVAPPNASWSKAEQDAYIPSQGTLLFTSVHEVWPGHFLQFLHSNRSSWRFGQLFVGYAFAEGWAHYSEEMMWEAGLGNGNPEIHIGQLQQALTRDVRYLCAIAIHAREQPPEDCEKMFREQAFRDPGNARQQAARGVYDPAYLNYTLGKLMIRRLRADWTATHGGRASWKAFHDQFLSYGGPPIPLVRKQMLGNLGGDLMDLPKPATPN